MIPANRSTRFQISDADQAKINELEEEAARQGLQLAELSQKRRKIFQQLDQLDPWRAARMHRVVAMKPLDEFELEDWIQFNRKPGKRLTLDQWTKEDTCKDPHYDQLWVLSNELDHGSLNPKTICEAYRYLFGVYPEITQGSQNPLDIQSVYSLEELMELCDRLGIEARRRVR